MPLRRRLDDYDGRDASPRGRSGHEPPIDYDKRLMLFSGRANPELGRQASPASSASTSGRSRLKTFSNGEVYCRYEESIRGADVFIVQPICGNPATGHHRQRRADGAAGDDRRGRRRARRTA